MKHSEDQASGRVARQLLDASTSAETCFDFVMEDSYGDGWNGAVYTLHDTTTAETVASGTLSSGSLGTDVVCFSRSGCYTLSLTSGSWPSEISWSFGGTVSGSAPYDSSEVLWVKEDGTLGAGSVCSTPSPTATIVPTVSLAPSPLPAPAPSLAPTVETLIFSAPIIVRTYTQLERAIRLAASNSTALVIDLLADISMISELNIESEVTIRSPVGAVLSGGGSTRLIYVGSAGTLVVENITLRDGYSTSVSIMTK